VIFGGCRIGEIVEVKMPQWATFSKDDDSMQDYFTN
jgi:hypothetical protein